MSASCNPSVSMKKVRFIFTVVLFCPEFIYPVQSSPRLASDVITNLNQVRLREVMSEIILCLQKYSLTGQIFTMDTELNYEGHLDSRRIQDSFIPTIVFGKRIYGNGSNRATPINATISSSRYNFPNYVHIRAFQEQPSKAKSTRKRRGRVSQFNPHWKTVYALTVGQSEFSHLPDRLRFTDYFINFGGKISYDSDQILGGHSRDIRQAISSKALSLVPHNVIKIRTEIQYKNNAQSLADYYVWREERDFKDISSQNAHNFRRKEQIIRKDTSTVLQPVPESKPESFRQFLICNSNENECMEEQELDTIKNSIVIIVYISCGAFCITESNINLLNFAKTADEYEPCRAVKGRENSALSPVACILHEVAVKLSLKTRNAPVVFSPGVEGEWSETGFSNVHSGTVEIFKRNIDLKVASNNFGRGGLFYNSLVFLAKKRFYSWDNTLRPLSLLGWIIIIIVCGAVAIVFALIKILTVSNSDQPWYDYVVQQMLDIMHEDRTGKKNKLLTMRSCDSDMSGSEENNAGDHNRPENDVDNSSNEAGSQSGHGGLMDERGKTSKAMLHGTIRIVSFVMVAIYEGKLYNTITFPKARFVSTFDELLTSDKYAVKLSREVADANFLGSKNFTMLSKFSESFNIEDCINWVEHSVSHGCVAYDFEFRNLPKAHKMRVLNEETIFAKSKTSVLNSLKRRPSPVTTALLHPAAQLSRWILEAGIFQFWMVAENFFMENLVPSKITKRKVFSIKDYVSLFLVYVSLLVLASFVFASEVIMFWVRKRFVKKSILGAFAYIWKKIKQLGLRLWGLWLTTKSFFISRQKCCIRMKRFINNIV